MRKAAALALLLASPALAALPRVALDVPLTPVVAAPAVAPLGASVIGASLLSPAPAAFTAAPATDAAVLAAAVAGFFPAAPQAAAPAAAPAAAALPASAPPPAPAAFAGLRADAAPTAIAAAPASAETAAAALERRFDGAAARDATDVSAAPEPGTDAAAARADAGAPDLLNRLLERVAIDAGGVPENGKQLRLALARMLQSPTARALAERYAAEGPPAVVRFESLPGTQPTREDGRAYFYGTRAFTDWTDGSVVVRVNDAYLRSDARYREQGLPAILAHELFGHGFWYARAAQVENLLLLFHHHDLNETNARLVGWLVDFELDQRFEETQAWLYLRDPQSYMDGLKLRLPYYAKTFSSAEMMNPVATLENRLAAARAARARVETEKYNQGTWAAVMDHFVRDHGVPAGRFRLLRAQFAQDDAARDDTLATLDALTAEVDAMLGRFKAEPDGASEKALRQVPSYPLFVELQRVSDDNLASLRRQVRESTIPAGSNSAEAERLRRKYWRGQIDFDELRTMYAEDRAKHPAHWR